MKKSKKKVASTMDERAQLISGESSARGMFSPCANIPTHLV